MFQRHLQLPLFMGGIACECCRQQECGVCGGGWRWECAATASPAVAADDTAAAAAASAADCRAIAANADPAAAIIKCGDKFSGTRHTVATTVGEIGRRNTSQPMYANG